MIRRYILPVLAVIGVAAAAVMVDTGDRPPRVAQQRFQPQQAPFSSYIFGPGIVEASTENISVGTPVSGIVTSLYVRWDERVRAGAPLFKVDTRALDAQLIPAKAHIGEVKAQLAAATAKVNAARETLAKAENLLNIGLKLTPGVSISNADLANRRFDVAIDKAALDSAEAQIDQIKAQIATAQAEVEQLQQEIAMHTVRAPVAGRILQMKIRPGEYAQTGDLSTPLMVLGNDTTLHVRVEIDQSDAWRFRRDAPAIAYVRGNEQLTAALTYARVDPDVVPQALLTGDSTQRTDTRVLQVIYSFPSSALPVYVGQLLDVFIKAPPRDGERGKP